MHPVPTLIALSEPTTMGDNQRTPALSLWRGGLLYELGRRTWFLRDDPLDVFRRSVAVGLVAWAPLMLLALMHGLIAGEWPPVLTYLPIHVRWWIAVPLLFFAERLVDERLMRMADYLRDSGLVSGASEARLGSLERQTMAGCNSLLIEGALLFIAMATAVPGIKTAGNLPALWLAAVTLPLSRFLFLRWVERWLFWTVLLAQIARLELQVNAMHPDRAGGLGALVLPSRGLGLVFTAVGSVIAADLFERLAPGESLDPHYPAIGTFAGICVAVATGPLMAFMPVLVRAKRSMLLSFGVFGQGYVRDFWQRWLPRAEDSPLGSSDIQSLADLGNSHQVVAAMRVVPFSRVFAIQIAASALVPLVPLYLHTVSMATLAAQLVKVVF